MTLTGAVNDLAGDAIAGSSSLLGGAVGEYIVFGLIVATVLLLAYVVYRFVNWGGSKVR